MKLKKKPRVLTVWPTDDEACAILRKEIGPTIAVGWSRGKDAVGCVLALRRHFEDIRPYFRAVVPGLTFVEDSLRYAEQFFGFRVVQVPDQQFWDWIDWTRFATRAHARALDAAQVLRNANVTIRTNAAVGDLWVAEGWRATDSLGRAVSLKRHGPIDRERKMLFPVGTWNDARLEREIAASGFRLPIDYKWFGRSFDSIRARFLGPIKRHAPADYEKIKRFFPLVEAELLRYKESTGEDAADSF